MRSRFLASIVLLSIVGSAFVAAGSTDVARQGPLPEYGRAFGVLKFRELGPAIMGGRTIGFAVVESDPKIVYAGLASGGVWKTTNAGTTWEAIFDEQPVASIGALALAPSDPSILWVGTGEPNNRQSTSWGAGVFKSTDAGRTFRCMGLENTHHIGRVAVHPKNPDIVYVAAVGHLWGPNPERGLYKTADGGRTWTLALFIDDDTGVTDVAVDPDSPDTVYAAAYQRRRTSFGFNGGGPGSAIYKSADGGATWKKMTRGLPYEGEDPAESQTGRIGLALYPRDPRILYAIVEHVRGGVFRSEDKGETWMRMSDVNPRPPYFSHIYVDPNNDRIVWVLGVRVYYSEDGGRTFDNTARGRGIHTDYHSLWINPNDSNHMLMGTDGGIHWSWDGGRTWDFVNTIAVGQFYEIGYDMENPYRITGGLQDNGSWIGPSRALYSVHRIGITNAHWIEVGGSDGYFTLIDPADPNTVYIETPDGNPSRRDLRTHESISIRPPDPEGLPRNRFQWNTPIVISAHDHKVLYYASQYLYRSPDRGDSWERISPDLTTGVEQNSLPTMGRIPDAKTLSRNFGVWNWPCVTAIGESPINPDLLWVGTDDGCLQVTRDRGRTWQNVISHVPGVPDMVYVSRVVPSRHAEGTAFVTFDNHRLDDFEVYVYVTNDFGRTFRAITAGIRRDTGTARVLREHHRNPDLLFLGTETGVFVTFDRGENWSPLRLNLPTVPVFDLAVHPRENDLILGTHGRSIWVLDDITPLEQLAAALPKDFHLFDIRNAVAWRIGGGISDHAGPGHKIFIAENPPYGAMIHYYLKTPPGDGNPVTISVADPSGRTIRVFEGTREAGINRVVWDLRHGLPQELAPASAQRGGSFGRLMTGPLADPGAYVVTVRSGKWTESATVTVEEDPRISISSDDRALRRKTITRAIEVNARAVVAVSTISRLQAALNAALETWAGPVRPAVPDDIRRAAAVLLEKADVLNPPIVMDNLGLEPSSPQLVWRPAGLTQRILFLRRALDGVTAAPTAQHLQELDALAATVDGLEASLKSLLEKDLAVLNRRLTQAGFPPISLAPAGRRP